MTDTYPHASLVVVGYQSADVLPTFIQSVLRLDYPSWDCTIIDNASTDGTAALARDIDPRLRVIEAETNLGFGRACNLGARSSDGELLVFLNPDVSVSPTWLRTIVDTLSKERDVAVICPQVLRPGDEPELGPIVEDVTTLAGAAMVVPRSEFNALGGFDERIFLYWEDTDLCWRAKLSGRRVVKDHSAYVTHVMGASGGGDRMAAEQIRNGLYVNIKLATPGRLARFILRMLAKTAVRFAQTRDTALFGAWLENLRRLPETLRLRRTALASVSRRTQLETEALLQSQRRWQRSAWAAVRRQ